MITTTLDLSTSFQDNLSKLVPDCQTILNLLQQEMMEMVVTGDNKKNSKIPVFSNLQWDPTISTTVKFTGRMPFQQWQSIKSEK